MFEPLSSFLTGQPTQVDWLFEGLLPRGYLVTLVGDAGTGKSTLSYALSLALASGLPFLGFHCPSPARVLYFDNENSRPDAEAYWRWAWHGLGKPPLPSIDANLTFAPFILGSRNWATQATTLVQQLQPALVVIDTATPCCAINDENDNAEATAVIQQLRSFHALAPHASVLVLKHAKLVHETREYVIRGAKAWKGSADSVLFLIHTPGKPPKNGLRPTRLEPAKARAYGLREPLIIVPNWTPNGLGLTLNRG